MRKLPIRLRLTLWYVTMFASAMVLLCMASLWMLQRSVDATEYHSLQERVDDVRVVLSREPPSKSLKDITADFASIYTSKDDGKYLQVRDDQGNWIYRSERMSIADPALAPPANLLMSGQITQFREGSHHVRVLAYSISAQGKHYCVQTGLSLDKSIVLLHNFRMNLLFLTPLMIVLAGLSGHIMSRQALRPITILTEEARSINDRNLDTRLPVSDVRDEVSHLAETLNQMLERIGKAFASVRAFTGNASHELRTPIALMRTEIEVALYRPRDPEEYRTTLTHLLEETVRMTSLAENLLVLARADAGADAIILVPISVNKLLLQIGSTWRSGMERAQLKFHISTLERDCAFLADAQTLPRLIAILLENAAKYTQPGGSVKLSAELQGSNIRLSVSDSGVGIEPEHLEYIFDRFYTVRPSGTSAARGSGLGLSIAQWIARCHGTKIHVESTPRQGSCFSFILRKVDADQEDTISLKPEDLQTEPRCKSSSTPRAQTMVQIVVLAVWLAECVHRITRGALLIRDRPSPLT